MTRQVNIGILIVLGANGDNEEGMVCANEIQGVVRREDVRATEKEKVVIGEGFRVGDLVRAVVVSQAFLPSGLFRRAQHSCEVQGRFERIC